nr:MAG TPA: hypothetical protein [Bacteriophage sp.]
MIHCDYPPPQRERRVSDNTSGNPLYTIVFLRYSSMVCTLIHTYSKGGIYGSRSCAYLVDGCA